MWYGGDAGCDGDTKVAELAQFLHHAIDFLPLVSLRIQDGLGVVEDDEYFPGREELPKGSQVIRVLNAGTNDLRKSAEEIGSRRRELVATDEPPVVTKSFLYAIVVEDSEGDRGFANATDTDESNGIEVLDVTNDGLDQFAATETSPRRGRGRLSGHARCKHELLDFLGIWAANLVWTYATVSIFFSLTERDNLIADLLSDLRHIVTHPYNRHMGV